MRKHLCLSIAFLIFLPLAQAGGVCRAKNSTAIINVFEQAITLNEKFKKSVGMSDNEEYRRLRKNTEKFNEETVMPCVRRAAQLLSKRSKLVLMHEFMKLVISYENSADETISYSIGEVFAANPKIIESAIKEFPDNGRKLISNSVLTGWESVKPGLDAAIATNRDERIKRLMPKQ